MMSSSWKIKPASTMCRPRFAVLTVLLKDINPPPICTMKDLDDQKVSLRSCIHSEVVYLHNVETNKQFAENRPLQTKNMSAGNKNPQDPRNYHVIKGVDTDGCEENQKKGGIVWALVRRMPCRENAKGKCCRFPQSACDNHETEELAKSKCLEEMDDGDQEE